MKRKSLKLAVYFMALFCQPNYAQSKDEDLIYKHMNFDLKKDTLYSSTGLKIFVGQKLILGNASFEGGVYRSIISNKAAIVPSIWGQDRRYENAIENYVDSKKNREKLTSLLIPGNEFTVKGISFSKTGKPYFYMVYLTSAKGECKADIKLALLLKELLFKL